MLLYHTLCNGRTWHQYDPQVIEVSVEVGRIHLWEGLVDISIRSKLLITICFLFMQLSSLFFCAFYAYRWHLLLSFYYIVTQSMSELKIYPWILLRRRCVVHCENYFKALIISLVNQ